jgi:GT2 family glycosyltransferase
MLDVIITRSDDTPGRWVKQAFDSVQAAIKAAPFPVTLIKVPGVPGHIGEAYMRGIAAATSEYLCWVDDDDFVLPQCFCSLGAVLSQSPQAVFTRQIDLHPNGWLSPRDSRSHLEILNRQWALTLDLTPFHTTPTQAIGAKADKGVDLMEWNYIHRLRRDKDPILHNTYFANEKPLWA